MFGLHDIPDYVAEPGWYTCGRCGKQERRIDWHNLEIRGNMIYRNNIGEVVTKYLADIEKIRKKQGRDAHREPAAPKDSV
jgi:hypothetical protein